MNIKTIQSMEAIWPTFPESLVSVQKMDRQDVISAVTEILETVRRDGDKALCDYTRRFDNACVKPEDLRVTEEEIDRAMAAVDPELILVKQKAKANIFEFHKAQVTPRSRWTAAAALASPCWCGRCRQSVSMCRAGRPCSRPPSS